MEARVLAGGHLDVTESITFAAPPWFVAGTGQDAGGAFAVFVGSSSASTSASGGHGGGGAAAGGGGSGAR